MFVLDDGWDPSSSGSESTDISVCELGTRDWSTGDWYSTTVNTVTM